MRIKARGVSGGQGAASAGALEAELTRLTMILYSMIGTALAGSGVVLALTTGNDTLQPILITAAIGAVAGLPVSWWIARQLESE